MRDFIHTNDSSLFAAVHIQKRDSLALEQTNVRCQPFLEFDSQTLEP